MVLERVDGPTLLDWERSHVSRRMSLPPVARRHEAGVVAALRSEDGRRLADAPLGDQVAGLEEALQANPVVASILARAPQLDLPSWYLGAGGVAQTVWNQLHGFDAAEGIKDYDLVYFDETDLSLEAEVAAEEQAVALFSDLGVTLDVKNEARVHLWYQQRFGRVLDAYASTEQAISTWPTTASSIGVRYAGARFVVCAPFGLRDLFAMIARPNKAVVSQAVFEEKANRWASRWPDLRVVPW